MSYSRVEANGFKRNEVCFYKGWEHGKVKHQVFYRNGVFLKYMSTFTRVFWRNNRWSYLIKMMHLSIYNKKTHQASNRCFFVNRLGSASLPVASWWRRIPRSSGGFMGVGTAQTFTHKKPASPTKVFNDTRKNVEMIYTWILYVYICIYI